MILEPSTWGALFFKFTGCSVRSVHIGYGLYSGRAVAFRPIGRAKASSRLSIDFRTNHGKMLPMSDPTFTFAIRDRIDAFEELADRFVFEIFDLPWALMTDESTLSDFNGCGLDNREDLKALDDEAYRAYWEEWVVKRVCEHYRVESFPVTIPMVQLLERIDRAAPLQ